MIHGVAVGKGNEMNKRNRAFLESWAKSESMYLEEVYTTCSQEKRNAWKKYYREYLTTDGKEFRLISHNSFGFTLAWLSADESTLIVQTPNNRYHIAL